MSNITSNSITVFPAARRADMYDISSRLLTERNVVDIVNRLVDIPSYVATTREEFGINNPFEFVIDGYWFKVDSLSTILNSFGPDVDFSQVYAYVTFDIGTTFSELAGQDDNGYYYGVTFTTTKNQDWDTIPNIKYLKLLQSKDGTKITSSNVEIPSESLVIFSESSLEINVDGGIVL